MANFFDTERGPVGRTHVWVIAAVIIVVVAVAMMIPELRVELFGAAVALHNAVTQ